MDRKKRGDDLELRVKNTFNSIGIKVKIDRSKKNGQIDLHGFNYKNGKEVFVECKSRRRGKIDNRAIAVFVNKLLKRKVIIDNKIRDDCEAYVVTDSYFTKDAEDDARLYGIDLIDNTKLSQIEALSRLDERYAIIKELDNVSSYIREQGLKGAISSWLRRKIFGLVLY